MKYFVLLLSILCLIGCKPKQSGNLPLESKDSLSIAKKNTDVQIPPLQEGEVKLSEDDFGKIIHLKGKINPVNEYYKVRETKMIVKDRILLVWNFSNETYLTAYSLPDFKFIKSFGKHGEGPGEFKYPALVPTEESNILAYLKFKRKFFRIGLEYEITEMNFHTKENHDHFWSRQYHVLSKDEIYEVRNTKKGKAIIKLSITNDTIHETLIKNLAFSKKFRSWSSYIGDFGLSKKHQRLVYAYKGFKRIMFYDLKTKKTKSIVFNNRKKTDGDMAGDQSHQNVTHYWGMSAQKDHVYLLYSGRTPIEVYNENKKSNGYIYVEQFDWNGNPIRKFKLDYWGYFCVTDTEDMIIMASNTSEEHPFISFDIRILEK